MGLTRLHGKLEVIRRPNIYINEHNVMSSNADIKNLHVNGYDETPSVEVEMMLVWVGRCKDRRC